MLKSHWPEKKKKKKKAIDLYTWVCFTLYLNEKKKNTNFEKGM